MHVFLSLKVKYTSSSTHTRPWHLIRNRDMVEMRGNCVNWRGSPLYQTIGKDGRGFPLNQWRTTFACLDIPKSFFFIFWCWKTIFVWKKNCLFLVSAFVLFVVFCLFVVLFYFFFLFFSKFNFTGPSRAGEERSRRIRTLLSLVMFALFFC